MVTLFILSIVIAIACFAVSLIKLDVDNKEYQKPFEIGFRISGGILVGLSILFLIISFLYIVNPGEVGVEILFGKVVKYAPSGMNIKNPLAKIVKMDLRTKKYQTKLEGASKDLQEIGIDIAINYRLDYEKIADLYNQVGVDYEVKVIEPAVMNLSKAAVSQFPIADVIVKRNELSTLILDSLTERLSKYYIILETVNLNNIAFAPSFTKVVEEKQIEEQKIKTAEYQKEQAKQKAEQLIIEAKAEAETKILNARAESEKQRLLKYATSKEVIELKWIEKWDGNLPTYMMGNAIPMVNINK